jgi:hypothetical protein
MSANGSNICRFHANIRSLVSFSSECLSSASRRDWDWRDNAFKSGNCKLSFERFTFQATTPVDVDNANNRSV